MTLDHFAHLRAESARFRAVLAGLDPATPVPPCPDWDAADLLYHLAEVQHFWATIVRDRVTDPEALRELERAEGYAAQLAQFDEASALLDDVLATTPDDVSVWTWLPEDQTVAFVRRRQAHEALIHRLDAELAAGAVTDVDAELATDGALEVLQWMYGFPPWAQLAAGGPIGRVATDDTGSSWLVRVGRWSGHSPNSGKDYVDELSLLLVETGEPVFEVAGPARDLDAWLWNRPTLAPITISGEADAFVEVIRSGVQ